MKKNQNSTSEKIKEIYQKSESLYLIIKEFLPFDFYCPNDKCSGKNGTRQMASAWKIKNGRYNIFCQCCGQIADISNSELKAKKQKFDKEIKIYKNKSSEPLDEDDGMYNIFEE